MSTTVEREADQKTVELAAELHELEEQEAALESRTRSLEFAGPLALILSLFAVALGLGAFVIALSNRSETTSASGSSSGVASSTNSAPGRHRAA